MIEVDVFDQLNLCSLVAICVAGVDWGILRLIAFLCSVSRELIFFDVLPFLIHCRSFDAQALRTNKTLPTPPRANPYKS